MKNTGEERILAKAVTLQETWKAKSLLWVRNICHCRVKSFFVVIRDCQSIFWTCLESFLYMWKKPQDFVSNAMIQFIKRISLFILQQRPEPYLTSKLHLLKMCEIFIWIIVVHISIALMGGSIFYIYLRPYIILMYGNKPWISKYLRKKIYLLTKISDRIWLFFKPKQSWETVFIKQNLGLKNDILLK